jgi:hypothetical protein
MGETRVDLLHLLEDLRDAYTGPTEETVLTEIVANSLDSGARAIALTIDPVAATLTIVDDGAGMRRRDLARYHDIAESAKVRGTSIGFAGVGIKVGLLVARIVITETRRGKHHVATRWGLTSRHRAPWRWIPPAGLVATQGTAISLALENPLSPLLDAGFVESTLRRHYESLFDPAFREALAMQYPAGVLVTVNGRALGPDARDMRERAAIAIRLGRRRRPAVTGYLLRAGAALPEDRQGLAISTLGKVIRRGWDWLGMAPANAECLGGLVEAPALAECLTLNKADLIRSGAQGTTYLVYRKAIQEAVSRQLAAWGSAPETAERERRRAARPVERDLETVLLDLADDFPMLAALLDRRPGGQRQLPVTRTGSTPEGNGSGEAPLLTVMPEAVAGALHADGRNGIEGGANGNDASRTAARGAGGTSSVAGHLSDVGTADRSAEAPPEPTPHVQARGGARRAARYGLSIQFGRRPDDPELGRLVDGTIWVNDAHPAYRRAVASRSEGYHVALATALALASAAVDPAREHDFVTAFLTSWGAALERRRARTRR